MDASHFEKTLRKRAIASAFHLKNLASGDSEKRIRLISDEVDTMGDDFKFLAMDVLLLIGAKFRDVPSELYDSHVLNAIFKSAVSFAGDAMNGTCSPTLAYARAFLKGENSLPHVSAITDVAAYKDADVAVRSARKIVDAYVSSSANSADKNVRRYLNALASADAQRPYKNRDDFMDYSSYRAQCLYVAALVLSLGAFGQLELLPGHLPHEYWFTRQSLEMHLSGDDTFFVALAVLVLRTFGSTEANDGLLQKSVEYLADKQREGIWNLRSEPNFPLTLICAFALWGRTQRGSGPSIVNAIATMQGWHQVQKSIEAERQRKLEKEREAERIKKAAKERKRAKELADAKAKAAALKEAEAKAKAEALKKAREEKKKKLAAAKKKKKEEEREADLLKNLRMLKDLYRFAKDPSIIDGPTRAQNITVMNKCMSDLKKMKITKAEGIKHSKICAKTLKKIINANIDSGVTLAATFLRNDIYGEAAKVVKEQESLAKQAEASSSAAATATALPSKRKAQESISKDGGKVAKRPRVAEQAKNQTKKAKLKVPKFGVFFSAIIYEGTEYDGWVDFGMPGDGEHKGMLEFHFSGWEGQDGECAWIEPTELTKKLVPSANGHTLYEDYEASSDEDTTIAALAKSPPPSSSSGKDLAPRYAAPERFVNMREWEDGARLHWRESSRYVLPNWKRIIIIRGRSKQVTDAFKVTRPEPFVNGIPPYGIYETDVEVDGVMQHGEINFAKKGTDENKGKFSFVAQGTSEAVFVAFKPGSAPLASTVNMESLSSNPRIGFIVYYRAPDSALLRSYPDIRRWYLHRSENPPDIYNTFKFADASLISFEP